MYSFKCNPLHHSSSTVLLTSFRLFESFLVSLEQKLSKSEKLHEKDHCFGQLFWFWAEISSVRQQISMSLSTQTWPPCDRTWSASLSLSASREWRSLSRRNSNSIFNPSPSQLRSHILDILRRQRDDQQDGGKALKLSVPAAVAAGFAVFWWAFVEMAQKSQQRLMNQTNRVLKVTRSFSGPAG